ncbi:MAG: Plug domain-containing protein [Candidatus Latescibacterota bacterium]|nr:MAG: Plug domain-containing protein [Candidatus Latescibacterota bacterium]
MRSALLLIFLAFVVPPWDAGADAGNGPAGRRVISKDEIREAGVSRLADILFLIDGWTPMTIDGFTWQVSPPGLGAYENQSWMVMVDGIRVDLNQFGITNLNRLPLSVGQIDSVEVVTLPQLYRGEFIGSGLIHFHTGRAGNRYWVRGRAAWGNETEDPGPYRYTEFATPNVDKIGPDLSVEGCYATDRCDLHVGYLQERHYATDAATRQRNVGIAAGAYPQINVIAPSVSFGGRLLGGEHHGIVGYSKFEDFFFFGPFGREIPVTSHHTMGGVCGRFERGGTIGVDYRVAYTVNEIGYRHNSLGLDFDWTAKTFTSGIEASHNAMRFPCKLGGAVERIDAKTGYTLVEDHLWLGRLYGEGRVGWSPAVEQALAVSTTVGRKDVSLNAMTAGSWIIGSGRRIDATVAYAERRPEEDGRIWYWRERGYGFLEDAGVVISADRHLGTARKWTVDTSVSFARDDPVSWMVSGFYRNHSNLFLEAQRYQFDPAEQAFHGPVRLVSGRGGDVIGCQIAAETRRIPRVRVRTAYRYQRALSGDRDFKNLWDTVPRHLFRQWMGYAPVQGFRLWAQLSYYSASQWHAYRDVMDQSNGVYRSTVDEFVTLDAAVEKCLWHDRGRGSLLFKNLLGDDARYHPVGASFDLSVFVQLELLLGSASE